MRLLSTLLICTTLALPMSATAFSAAAATGTISVTGTATVNVVPDLATLSLGVTTSGDTAAAAMAANSAGVTAVIARLKAAGIADRDMQTSNLSLNPNWVPDESGSSSVIKGYVASNILTVQIKAMDRTGAWSTHPASHLANSQVIVTDADTPTSPAATGTAIASADLNIGCGPG